MQYKNVIYIVLDKDAEAQYVIFRPIL